MSKIVVVAGATGNLGGKIASHIVKRGGVVRALVRKGTDPKKLENLEKLGAHISQVDFASLEDLTHATHGAYSVVSALQGLHDIIVGTQSLLLEAAIASGLHRFIPSDFSLDYTKVPKGNNRNSDLRREFREKLLKSPIQGTSILNGGFTELLNFPGGFVDQANHKTSYWGNPDQKLYWSTTDTVADYTAAAALDPDPLPDALRIAGDVLNVTQVAQVLSEVKGVHFDAVSNGTIESLSGTIQHLRAANPASENQLFPNWQFLMYARDMYSGDGAFDSLDNARYPDVHWVSVKDFLTAASAGAGGAPSWPLKVFFVETQSEQEGGEPEIG